MEDWAIVRLTNNPAVSDLLTLDLGDSPQLHVSTLGSLARSPHLSGLRQLILSGSVCLGAFARSILTDRFGDRVQF